MGALNSDEGIDKGCDKGFEEGMHGEEMSPARFMLTRWEIGRCPSSIPGEERMHR